MPFMFCLLPGNHLFKNNKIIRVERKSNNKTIENYSCPKIKAATQIIYSPDRLKKPMIKKKEMENPFGKKYPGKQH